MDGNKRVINMKDFKKLCEKIIATDGNPSVNDVLECGYSMDDFIRIAQPNINKEKLLAKAKEMIGV